MGLVSPSRNINNSKLYFSKYELTALLNCYSIGVSKGNWKDYAVNFTSNEAFFFIYKNSFSLPDYIICKFNEKLWDLSAFR